MTMTISNMDCHISQLHDMSLQDCARYILTAHGLHDYTVAIDEGLPHEDRLILFRPESGKVIDVLAQLAGTYGGLLHVIDNDEQHTVEFVQSNYY